MDNWINNNTVLKILSLIFAFMLWMVVNFDRTTPSQPYSTEPVQNTYFYETKVLPIYNDEEYVVKMTTEEVKVTLRGNQDVINQIRNGILLDKSQFYIDLTEYKEGVFTIPIQYKGFPSKIEVEVQPDMVQVQLEAKKRKEFEVLVDKLGKEEDGYQAGDPIIKPQKVYITGTQAQIDQVAYVKAFVNIDHAKDLITQQVPLRALDKNGNQIQARITPQTVEVQIPVTSPFLSIPITYSIENDPPEGFAIESIQQLTKEVILYGSKEIIEGYNVYIGPAIDLSDKESGSYPIKYQIPLDPNLLKTEPEFLELEVTIVESATKSFSNVPIEINGLGNGLTAEIISPKDGVNMILEGAPKILDALSSQELQVFLDVTNLPPGEHEVPINFNVPLFTKNLGNEEKAKVRIAEE